MSFANSGKGTGSRVLHDRHEVARGHPEVEVLALLEHGRRDADDLAVVVEDRAARGAGRDGRRDLEDLDAGVELATGAHQPVRYGVFEAQRISDGDDRVAGSHRVAVAQRDHRQVVRVDAHEREIVAPGSRR